MEQGFGMLGQWVRVLFPGLHQNTARANGAIEFFLASRLIFGVGGLAILPLMVVSLDLDRLSWLVVILGLAAQFGAVLLATQEQVKFETAYALSLAGLASAFAAFSGHMGLMALIPCVIEAGMMLDRRFAFATGSILTVIVMLTLLAGDGLTAIAPLGTAAFLSSFVLALTATGIGVSAWLDRLARRDESYQNLQITSAALVDVLDRGVAISDIHGKIFDPSYALMTMTGLPPHEILDDALLSRVHLLYRPAYLKALSDALHSNMPVETRVKIQCRAQGDEDVYRSFDVRVSAIESPHAAHERHAVISLAEVKEVEINLAPLRDTLYQAQLRHELKTPLNAILGFSELLTNPAIVPEDDPRRHDYIRIIATSARHLVDIIDNMKADAEIALNDTPDMDAVAIAPLIKDVLAMMKLAAEEQRVVIEEQIEENLPPLLGHPHGLRQIIINLVSNAVKYAPDGRVVIAAERHFSGVQLCVSDDGIGMDDQELQRVGEPYFRGSASAAGFLDGEGLGLGVVRGLVERHGGELTIESAPGNGTTARVVFSRVKRDVPTAIRSLAEIEAQQAPVPVDLVLNDEWRRQIA